MKILSHSQIKLMFFEKKKTSMKGKDIELDPYIIGAF